MKTAILILITFSLCAERSMPAQGSLTKEVFPLSINNSWKYSYTFSNYDIGNADGTIQFDSGLVQFAIVDSTSNIDTVFWTMQTKSVIIRTLKVIEALQLYQETTYVVTDSSVFKMYELRKDNHLLSLAENMGFVSVWPFYSSNCGNDSVFRYQIVDSSFGTSSVKTTYCDTLQPNLSMTYQLIFHSDSGLISNAASGRLGYHSHSLATLSCRLIESNIILRVFTFAEIPILELEPMLFQNYPNPFNPMTTFGFMIPRRSLVTLKVYNIIGQQVATLESTVLDPGYYQRTFDASHLSSGPYFYRMESVYLEDKHKAFDTARKMLIIK
jgi:hypothetical protein